MDIVVQLLGDSNFEGCIRAEVVCCLTALPTYESQMAATAAKFYESANQLLCQILQYPISRSHGLL